MVLGVSHAWSNNELVSAIIIRSVFRLLLIASFSYILVEVAVVAARATHSRPHPVLYEEFLSLATSSSSSDAYLGEVRMPCHAALLIVELGLFCQRGHVT